MSRCLYFLVFFIPSLCLFQTVSADEKSMTNEEVTLELDVVIIEADKPKTASDLLKETQIILDEQALQKQNKTSLGELLSKQPGIHNQSYGVNSGKPVIRSLTGPRVRILNNQLQSSEAANISSHLSTGISPQSASEVEVLGIGASILYGGGAIGGAINVKDSIIADKYYTQPTGRIGVQSSVINGSEEQSLNLSGSLSPRWSWSLYGFNYYRPDVDIAGNSKADLCYELGSQETGLSVVVQDLCQVKIPHEADYNPKYFQYLDKYYVENPSKLPSELARYASQELRQDGTKNPLNPLYDPNAKLYIYRLGEIQDLTPNQKNRLNNSGSERQAGKAGIAYLMDKGRIGLAFEHNENHYGVPFYTLTNNKTGVKELAPVSTYGSEQRLRAHLDYQFNLPLLSHINIDATKLKARNDELVANKVMSEFFEQQEQLRIELAHRPGKPVAGSIGYSLNTNNIDTKGKDRYLPDMQVKQEGFFLLEKFKIKKSTLTFGLRNEKVSYKNKETDKFTPLRHGSPTIVEREFSASSHFVNLNLALHDVLRFSFTHSKIQRAPAVHELYANGNHYAILTAEAGDESLATEQAIKNEMSLIFKFSFMDVSLTKYDIDYDNYIYLAHTGIFDSYSNLYKKAWRQSDSKLSGYELQAKYYFGFKPIGNFELSSFADLVKNYPKKPNRMQKHSEGEYLPGLPTSRVGAGIAWSYAKAYAHLDGVHYFVQKHRGKVINLEPELPAYTLVDARIGYELFLEKQQVINFYIQGFNLLNQAARAYNSPIKYLAPSAGRSIVAGFDYSF